jgi:hypothetical protein
MILCIIYAAFNLADFGKSKYKLKDGEQSQQSVEY